MLVQAAGTGASAGAVSESDMSVVVAWDVPVLCPVAVLRTPLDPGSTITQRERERDRQWK